MLKKIFQSSMLLILIVLFLLPLSARAATYYIDWVDGADTNDGLTKATPWKRAPGMHGCSGNCLLKKNAGGNPGDRFILKGGVTWPKDALSWDWYFGSGTQTTPIYFGVDSTWYSGSTWSRPKLDAENQTPNASPEGTISIMRVYGNWFVVDNIEFKRLSQLDNSANEPRMLLFGTSSSSGGEVKNNYFHGWSHGGSATLDRLMCLSTALINEGPDMNLKIHHNVFDGADTTGDMAMAYKGSAGHFYNNYISSMANGVLGNPKFIWGNTFKNIGHKNFDATSHMNSIETLGGESVIYNNFFDDPSGGVTIWTENEDGDIDYVFNNVVRNDSNQGLQISNLSFNSGSSTGIYVFNNTLHAYSTTSGPRISGPSFTSKPYMAFGKFWNNHLISNYNNSVEFNRITSQVESNTVNMTNSEASNEGYSVTGSYPPFYPISGGATVGTGKELQSIVSQIPSTSISDAATAALSDTTCGIKYDSDSHTVIGPSKTPVLRGTNWDVGAYQYHYSANSNKEIPYNLRF